LHPARQKILEYLKRHGQATITELAEHLDMAPVSVRHHLDLLIGDNLVEASRVRRKSGAGRPKRLYALTPQADALFPNNYQKLAGVALDVLRQVLSPEAMTEVMQALAEETLRHAPDDLASLPPEQRLQAAVDFLNQEGYMAFCECAGEEILLHTCHCPYKDLVASHPEICSLDDTLVQRLTGMRPVRITQILHGGTRCTYRLLPQEEAVPAESAVLPMTVET
jgi:predicted ArsR family transcriptional regulator